MQINEDFDVNRFRVRSCTNDEVIVVPPLIRDADAAADIMARGDTPPARPQDIRITHSVVITPRRLIENWPPRDVEELRPEHFEALVGLNLEVVLLGTGSRIRFPHPSQTALLLNHGIGVEVMDTPAACRTYNFLMADGRNVAAALLFRTA